MRTFEIPFRIAVYVVYSMDGDFINLKLQLIVEQNMILAIFDLRKQKTRTSPADDRGAKGLGDGDLLLGLQE